MPMNEDIPPKPANAAGLLEDLGARVRAAAARGKPPEPADVPGRLGGGMGGGVALAFRVGVELVSAVFLGAVIGLFLDKWLGTAPLFLIVLLFLGAAAGFLNVYRTVTGIGLAVGYKSPPGTGNGEEGKG